MLTHAGTSRGGVVATEGRSAFLAWVQVADLESTLAGVQSAGGRSLSGPHGDPAVRRMAVVADPAGAVFGLVQVP